MLPSTLGPSDIREERRTRRAFVWIAVVAVVLFAGLSVAWYVLADRLDSLVRTEIARSGRLGVDISCENQTVFGYPFRLGLHCDALGVDAPARKFRLVGGTLRTAAQIYQPNKLVAELDAPLLVAAEGAPPLDLRWTLGQASAHFWTEGLDRLAIVLEAPVLALAEPAGGRQEIVRSERLEAHVRRRDADLDLAFTDAGIVTVAPQLAGLPAFDIDADMTIAGAANWLSGEDPGRTLRQAFGGRSGTIRTLRIALAGARPAGGTEASTATDSLASAEVSGPFEVDAEGVISGDFDLVVADPRGIAELVSELAPQFSGIAGSIATGIGFAGRTENGRTTIRITVRDGNAALGVIPLGKVPALR